MNPSYFKIFTILFVSFQLNANAQLDLSGIEEKKQNDAINQSQLKLEVDLCLVKKGLNLRVEYLLNEDFSFGIGAGRIKGRDIGIGADPNERIITTKLYVVSFFRYNYKLNEKIQGYSGVSVGYGTSRSRTPYLGNLYYTGLMADAHTGIRYVLTERVHAIGEVGLGLSVIKFGVSFQL